MEKYYSVIAVLKKKNVWHKKVGKKNEKKKDKKTEGFKTKK